MIKRILLDIDDVCNRCTQYAFQWHHIPMDYDKFEAYYPSETGYDIVAAANKVLGFTAFDVKSFWSMIPRAFWASCPVSEEFLDIMDLCVGTVGKDNICFLTGPTKDPDCLAGKLEWITANSPQWMHRQYLIGPRKQFCAHHEALLVDDNDANINTFREWGGHGILVPRPWNTNRHLDTDVHVRRMFEEFRHLVA